MPPLPSRPELNFRPYERTTDLPNIVVDGSPNASTVLTLTHWPGFAQPPGLGADLSAEMAFNYLDAPPAHPRATCVTNNHFDQDGLVGIHTLMYPEASLRHRAELIDLAACGDFATTTSRATARASMTIWAYAQPDLSPLGSQLQVPYPEACALLYTEVLPLLIAMITGPESFRDLWHDEDVQLTASQTALRDGRVQITEMTTNDLAIVHVNDDSLEGGHRFASDLADFVHPIAIHNATTCSRLLLVRGHDYRYIDRYEGWVQYRSRSIPQRVDMSPVADRLTALETSGTTWAATAPSVLTPCLRPNQASSLDAETVRDSIVAHLDNAPAAWDPFRVG